MPENALVECLFILVCSISIVADVHLMALYLWTGNALTLAYRRKSEDGFGRANIDSCILEIHGTENEGAHPCFS